MADKRRDAPWYLSRDFAGDHLYRFQGVYLHTAVALGMGTMFRKELARPKVSGNRVGALIGGAGVLVNAAYSVGTILAGRTAPITANTAGNSPQGPSGPIGATGNSPGGQVPGQPEGPGLLTKAAVHVVSSLPTVAPAVQAVKDPETAVRLGIGALNTATTVQAARMLNPAARAGAKFLTKAMLPLTVALAAMDTVKGYEKDGVKGAALGLADSLTGGLLSLGLEKAGVMQPGQPGQPAQPSSAPATPQAVVSDRLDVARAAASRVTGEMSQTTVMNQGSTRPANAEIPSDGMTDDYFRQQNGRQVRVSGYQTPSR